MEKIMSKNCFKFVFVIYFFLFVPSSFAAILHWSPVESTENCVIAGYKVHYSTTGYYTQVVDVGNATSYDVDILGLVPTQTYFFAVNAYSTTNQDGPLSLSVSYNGSNTANTNSFVTRFYEIVLGRTPDQAGLDYWVSELQNGNLSGEDLAHSFINSEEFININTSDDDYVEILYQSFFNRASDIGGYEHWMAQFSMGADRVDVLNGFVRSLEFDDLCNSYGINRLSVSIAEIGVSQFVTRFYEECLNRSPDSSGLAHWTEQLQNKTQTGKTLAMSFIFSVEFESENTTDYEFVTILYQAFLNRAPETEGVNNWMDKLSSGTSRSTVLDGFTGSAEFIKLCKAHGITPY